MLEEQYYNFTEEFQDEAFYLVAFFSIHLV